jgi:cytochrome c-type biogenesis protein
VDTPALFWLSFLAGIYAPLGSPCVLVLYPGYLSFLAGLEQDRDTEIPAFSLGAAVAAGVILSLLVGGILFATILGAMGAAARTIITPSIYVLLLIISIAMLLDIDVTAVPGRYSLPRAATPHLSAFLLGLCFGIIILPCNSAIILFLLALATSVPGDVQVTGLFLAFGAGVTLPLLLLAVISRLRSRQVIGFLTRHRLPVQRIGALIMLVIALYYLILFFSPGIFG